MLIVTGNNVLILRNVSDNCVGYLYVYASCASGDSSIKASTKLHAVYAKFPIRLLKIMASTDDFNIFKALWQNVNDVCAPPPPPGQPAKACFLMELPGFTINPDSFDSSKFDPKTMVSPDMLVATLCDRVPALACYFYDTGNHISFFLESTYKDVHSQAS